MAQCPSCGMRGAYVGFSRIECRNIECAHYTENLPEYCGNCDQEGHSTYDCPQCPISLSKDRSDCEGSESWPSHDGPPSSYSASFTFGVGATGSATFGPDASTTTGNGALSFPLKWIKTNVADDEEPLLPDSAI